MSTSLRVALESYIEQLHQQTHAGDCGFPDGKCVCGTYNYAEVARHLTQILARHPESKDGKMRTDREVPLGDLPREESRR